MGYRLMTMYVAVCDGCQAEPEDDEYGAWSTRQDADEAAQAQDWTTVNGRHVCPSCQRATVADPPVDPVAARHSVPGPADVPLIAAEPGEGRS